MSSLHVFARRVKAVAGVLVKDLLRYHGALGGGPYANSDPPWVRLGNRNERLEANPAGPGVRCDWRWTSRLHACDVLPVLGRRLQHRVFRDHPVRFAERPEGQAGPKITFLFAHRGRDRLAQLNQVLRSAFAQRGVRVECVVVDLSPEPLAAELPENVAYVHVKTSGMTPGWYKAWAYNIGARRATGDVLVFHDGDLCMPCDYGQQLARWLVDDDWEVASLQRFLFYSSEAASEEVLRTGALSQAAPECVLQNWKGGTIALRRECFSAIGGFDEGFVDWGGEDDEFFDRCRTLKHLRFGYLPFLHLWHRQQPDRHSSDNLNETHVLPRRLAISAATRTEELVSRASGEMSGPDPPVRYKDQVAYRDGDRRWPG